MLTLSKYVNWVAALVIAVLLSCPAIGAAQDDEQGGQTSRQRMKRPGPEKIKKRIAKLREEGVAEDDPRIERLHNMLRIMEEGGPPGSRSGFSGPDGEGRPGGLRQHSPEEIQAFVDQHPELRDLLGAPGEGPPLAHPKHTKRAERQIVEIMTAMEEGKNQLAGAMIDNAKMQLSIGKKLREYHQASEGSAEQTMAREEMSLLVRQQVQTDLALQELKLQNLRERLVEQEARLAEDRTRQDELAAKKLEHLLSRKPGEKGKRFKPGRFGPGGDQDAPEKEMEPLGDQ